MAESVPLFGVPSAEREARKLEIMERRITQDTADATGPVSRSPLEWRGQPFQRVAWERGEDKPYRRRLLIFGFAQVTFSAHYDARRAGDLESLLDQGFHSVAGLECVLERSRKPT